MRKWRVGTFSMGAMLIVVGLLLLCSEIWGWNGSALIIRWWPAILIILGVEILAYIGFSREEQPKLKFDGLSIFLVILIILLSTGVYAVNNVIKSDVSQGILGEIGFYKNETVILQNYDIKADQVKKLQINNSYGRIEVEKYDGSDIKIDASIIVRNNDEEKARQLVENIVEVAEGENLLVNTRNKGILGDSRNNQIEVNYSVKVPKELVFEIKNEFGETKLENLRGQVMVTGKYGIIEVSDIQGDVQIENSFGETTIKNVTGKLTAENEQGEIRYSSIENVTKDISLNCKMGSITLELPENQQGTFEVLTKYGDISTEGFDFAPPTDVNNEKESVSQHFKEIIGAESPLITARAEHGSINIYGK